MVSMRRFTERIRPRRGAGGPRDKGRPPFSFKGEHLALMGKMSDEDLAKLAGTSASTVSAKRRSLQIKAFSINSRRSKAKDLLLAQLKQAGSIARLAEQTGKSISGISKRVKAYGILESDYKQA